MITWPEGRISRSRHGGKLSDIPKGTPRRYPHDNPRPVWWSIQTWKGIVSSAHHYTVIFELDSNPYVCNCDGDGLHYHEPWAMRDKGGEVYRSKQFDTIWEALHDLRRQIAHYRATKKNWIVKSRRSRYR